MLRPCFGQRGLLSVSAAAVAPPRVYVQAESLVVESQSAVAEPVIICNLLGQPVYQEHIAPRSVLRTSRLPHGIYMVRLGDAPAVKVVIVNGE